jgi:TatD DNase family protein
VAPTGKAEGSRHERPIDVSDHQLVSVFYDTHAHLSSGEFQRDLAEVLARADLAGIRRILCVGIDLESSRRAVQLAEIHPTIYATVGWHPTHANDAPDDVRPGLRDLAKHPKVVAIGETGLDYFHLPSKRGGTADDDRRHRERQQELFRQQLELAAELSLNCVVHQRNSFADTIEAVRPFAGRVRGQFHCFSEDVAALPRVLELGSLVSYTGILTFKNSATVRAALAATPLDQFMLETDAPYLAPAPYRGKRCEPAYLREIAAVAAEVRGISLDELSFATCATAHAFFPRMAG